MCINVPFIRDIVIVLYRIRSGSGSFPHTHTRKNNNACFDLQRDPGGSDVFVIGTVDALCSRRRNRGVFFSQQQKLFKKKVEALPAVCHDGPRTEENKKKRDLDILTCKLFYTFQHSLCCFSNKPFFNMTCACFRSIKCLLTNVFYFSSHLVYSFSLTESSGGHS